MANGFVSDEEAGAALIRAIHELRPEGQNQTGWYLELAEIVGRDEKTIENWKRGVSTPKWPDMLRLCAHPKHGLAFAGYLFGPANLHFSHGPEEAERQLSELRALHEQSGKVLSGETTVVPLEKAK